MSTRCITIFKEDGKNVAAFYRHHDGYPDGHGEEVRSFLVKADLEKPLSEIAGEFAAELNAGENRPILESIEEYSRGRMTSESLAYTDMKDVFAFMKPSDWEYAYLVEKDKDGVTLTTTGREEILDLREKIIPENAPGMGM